MHFSAMLSEEQNSKYKVNILRVKRKSTTRVYFVAILAPVFAQLIQTLDWDQNSGVRLFFGLSKKTQWKTNPKSEVTHCSSNGLLWFATSADTFISPWLLANDVMTSIQYTLHCVGDDVWFFEWGIPRPCCTSPTLTKFPFWELY